MTEPTLSHQPSCTCLQCNPQSVEAPATHHLTKPTLSHDIEEWIKDHSHAGLWDRTVDQGRAIDQLEDRVAVLENGLFNALTKRVKMCEEFDGRMHERVAELEVLAGMRAKGLEERVARLETWVIQNEPHFETDDGAIEHLPQEPRGPHD